MSDPQDDDPVKRPRWMLVVLLLVVLAVVWVVSLTMGVAS